MISMQVRTGSYDRVSSPCRSNRKIVRQGHPPEWLATANLVDPRAPVPPSLRRRPTRRGDGCPTWTWAPEAAPGMAPHAAMKGMPEDRRYSMNAAPLLDVAGRQRAALVELLADLGQLGLPRQLPLVHGLYRLERGAVVRHGLRRACRGLVELARGTGELGRRGA